MTTASPPSNGHHASLPVRPFEIAAIFAFWTFMAVLATANQLLDPRGRGLQPVIASAPAVLAFSQAYLWAAITTFVFSLVGRHPVDRANLVRRGLLYLALGIVVAILIDAFVAYLRFGVFFLPRRRPPGGHSPFFGLARLFWLDDLITYVAVLAASLARYFFLRFHARREEMTSLVAESARLQAQLAEARLSALRTQLNPHFLFNTLNAVSSLVERDPKGVRRMIARLSDLLRHTLEGSEQQQVPLDRELSFLERYLDIMRIRFEGKLDVSVDVPSTLHTALVPNLFLQPLVENALEHGVGNIAGAARLEIAARRDDEMLHVSVFDNGAGIGEGHDESREGVGLGNTRQRLAQLYGEQQSLVIRRADRGGTIVEVTLPYHTADDLRTSAAPVRW